MKNAREITLHRRSLNKKLSTKVKCALDLTHSDHGDFFVYFLNSNKNSTKYSLIYLENDKTYTHLPIPMKDKVLDQWYLEHGSYSF